MTQRETYMRVIPRDFFNEAKLLKCFGQLSLKILDGMLPEGVDVEIVETGEPFYIDLTDDGCLFLSNYHTTINDVQVLFKSRYNSKSNYPFICEYCYDEYDVFSENGEFTDDFKALKYIIK